MPSSGATSRRPGVRRMSCAVGPVSSIARSTSPLLSAAARVVSSGMLRKTIRLIDGGLRQ